MGFTTRMQNWVNKEKSINVRYLLNRIKDKKAADHLSGSWKAIWQFPKALQDKKLLTVVPQLLSGLRTQHYHRCGLGCQCGMVLILGNLHAGCGPPKTPKSKQKTNKHSQQRLDVDLINLIKGIPKKPTANFTPNGERLEASPDIIQIWMPFLTTSIQHCTRTMYNVHVHCKHLPSGCLDPILSLYPGPSAVLWHSGLRIWLQQLRSLWMQGFDH